MWNLASFGVVVVGVLALVIGVQTEGGVECLSLRAALPDSSSNSESDTSEISTCTNN